MTKLQFNYPFSVGLLAFNFLLLQTVLQDTHLFPYTYKSFSKPIPRSGMGAAYL